ncbi:MAG: hypothetical protein P8X74_12275 [Reinekea sp.]
MLKILFHPLMSSVLAFIAYGLWAAFSNWEFGQLSALKALLIQGSFAFSATLFLTLLAKTLYFHLGRNLAAFAGAFFICFLIISIVPATLHWLAHTPNILQTILPGLVWSSVYLLIVIQLQHREAQQQMPLQPIVVNLDTHSPE